MKQELVFREVQIFGFLRGEYNAIGALFQCCFELQPVSVELTLRVDQNTTGMISAGCVVSWCASSSLYEIKCAMSTSQ